MFDRPQVNEKVQIYDQASDGIQRYINPEDITLPPGYRIEVFAQGLDAPSGMVFTEEGDILIGESGYSSGRVDVLRLHDGNLEMLADGFIPPITGLNYYKGNIYVSHRGKVTVIRSDGTRKDIINGLQDYGDYWNSRVAIGDDEKLYIGQGTATNSGVVGTDNVWALDHPFVCDNPGTYIMLNGQNFVTNNIFTNNDEDVLTGAFSPFGVPNMPYEVRKGLTKAAGSILRANQDGTGLELVAWGFRYPVYLKYDRLNRLFVSNQTYEIRGSRPIANAPDEFHIVTPGIWYGWPDYSAGEPVTSSKFKPEGGVQPEFLLTNHPNLPPYPYATFPPFSYVAGFDFNYNSEFGPYGDAYIAEFGGGGRIVPGVLTPYIGIGHRISKIDMNTGEVTTFAMNKSGFPSFVTGGGGLSRPADVEFGPDGALYVLDLGTNYLEDLSSYQPNTGVIWKITRT